jgi:hypothetical protein
VGRHAKPLGDIGRWTLVPSDLFHRYNFKFIRKSDRSPHALRCEYYEAKQGL